MHVLSDLSAYLPDPSCPLVLGLGNFDGVHRGHEALLRQVVGRARELKGLAGVFTFHEHPQRVLHPGNRLVLLTSNDQKLFLLEQAGIDLCFLMRFDHDFSKLEASDFVKEILVRRLQVHEIWLGYNSRFGHDRKGDVRLMKKLSAELGFEFGEMKPVKVEGDFVSSSRIRSLLEKGELAAAEACLGRPYRVFAKVVRGEGRGRELGYPTANLETSTPVLLPEGVYAARLRVLEIEKKVLVKGREGFEVSTIGPWHEGALNYGSRPTFQSQVPEGKSLAEIFLFDFKGDLYGTLVEVECCVRLRSEKRFEDPNALKAQIQQDAEAAKRYFKRAKPLK